MEIDLALIEQQLTALRRQAGELTEISQRLQRARRKLDSAWVSSEAADACESIDTQIRRVNRAAKEADSLYLDIRQALADIETQQAAVQ